MTSTDLVVVLPGILGSTLGVRTADTPATATPIWAPTAGALWRGLTGGPKITDYPLPDQIGDDHHQRPQRGQPGSGCGRASRMAATPHDDLGCGNRVGTALPPPPRTTRTSRHQPDRPEQHQQPAPTRPGSPPTPGVVSS